MSLCGSYCLDMLHGAYIPVGDFSINLLLQTASSIKNLFKLLLHGKNSSSVSTLSTLIVDIERLKHIELRTVSSMGVF